MLKQEGVSVTNLPQVAWGGNGQGDFNDAFFLVIITCTGGLMPSETNLKA